MAVPTVAPVESVTMTVAPSNGAPVAATPDRVEDEVLVLPPPPPQADKRAATQIQAVVFSKIICRINFPTKVK